MNVLEKIQRKRAKRIGDPEGVLSTLQVARRLLSERGDKGVYPALDDSLSMSVPKDRARAWWAAHRALINALPGGHRTIGEFLWLSSTSVEDVLAVFDRAIKLQGEANIVQSKGKRPKLKGEQR